MQVKQSRLFYFLLVLCPLQFMLLLFQNCSTDKLEQPASGETVQQNKTSKMILGGASYCADTACFGYDPSFLTGKIDFATAKKMADLYAGDKGKFYIMNGDQYTGEQDARSIWFDLKKLKQFIGFIESAMCKAGCFSDRYLGIRFYYAKYPTKNDMQLFPTLYGLPLEYANHHTLFMIPTYWDPLRKVNVDFDPAGVKENCGLVPIDPTKGHAYIAVGEAESGTDGENHGGLRPPPENSASFPITE
ncbi:MAG: hypothetical protein JNM68_13225 [Dinghuibacter sp.]|nr:hypothetical protein [Dinghuibacter sp.]